MKSKILKIIVLITIVLMILFIILCNSVDMQEIEYTLMDDIDYTESLENIKNPERGFYSTAFLKLMPSGSKPSNSGANLVHLRVDIGNFSKAVNGIEDMEFTEDALNALDQTFSNIRVKGGSVIIRFAYDGFNGHANLEPSLDMILKHISQLKPVFEKNKDVIAYVELGFFGPWGEMHTSKVSSTDNVSKAIDVMLDTVPETIKIGVRTPNYYVKWLGIDRKNLNENITQKGTDAYRVGLYNDGYLGSESDLGTFANREIEIAWLENQARHTFYGGEVVANYASKTPLNTVEYMSKEAFRTHTTYLNSEWNNTVINAWKNEIYNGDDDVYKGKDGYTYIANHLGYRFVLRKSEIVNKIEANESLKIKLQIENVGFANLINDKIVTLILEQDGKKYEIPTNINPTDWNSKEISNVNLDVKLPENINLGEWKIYLRISQSGNMETDNNYKCIQFANPNIWEETFGANYIGKVEISEVTIKTPVDESNNEIGGNTITENNSNKNDNEIVDDSTNKNDNEITDNNTNKNDNEITNNNNITTENTDKNNNEKADTNKNQNNGVGNNTIKTETVNKNTNIKNSKDTTIASKNLPKTGEDSHIILILIFVCIVSMITFAIKLNKIK